MIHFVTLCYLGNHPTNQPTYYVQQNLQTILNKILQTQIPLIQISIDCAMEAESPYILHLVGKLSPS